MARGRAARDLDRDRHPARVPGRGAHRQVARARQWRLRRSRRGERPRVRPRLRGDRAADDGRHRAHPGPRRGDGRGALDPRVDHHLPDADVHLRHRSARHADRRRRPGLRDRLDRAHPLPGRRDRRRDLGEGHSGGVRHEHPRLGHVERAARRRRPGHLSGRRRAGRIGDGVRQAHRCGGLARAGDPHRDGLQPAPDHRGGRRPAVDRLAPARAYVTRSRDRRGVLGRAVRGARQHDGGRRRPERLVPVRVGLLHRIDDDAARPRPPVGLGALEGRHQPRPAERHRGRRGDRSPRGDDHAARCRRLHLRHRQPRAGARAAGRHRRANLGGGGAHESQPLGIGLLRPARRPLLRLQRERRSDHRAVQPEGYVELDRTHLLNATSRSGYGGSRAGTRSRYRHGQSDRLVVWAHPAFANRHVVLRNDEEIVRVSLDEDDYR